MPLRDDFVESGIVGDREIDGIAERKSRPAFCFGPVTAGTILFVEQVEIGDVVRVDGNGIAARAARANCCSLRKGPGRQRGLTTGFRRIFMAAPPVLLEPLRREFRFPRGQQRE